MTKTPPALQKDRVYSWDELGDICQFKPDWLGAVGGMASLPNFDALLLITHPGGGKSFDYEDYWDGGDLIYTARGKSGDQKLAGENGFVAENTRHLLVLEHVALVAFVILVSRHAVNTGRREPPMTAARIGGSTGSDFDSMSQLPSNRRRPGRRGNSLTVDLGLSIRQKHPMMQLRLRPR